MTTHHLCTGGKLWLLVVAFVFLFAPGLHAAEQDLQSADVYQQATVVRAELENLRWLMGRPVNQQLIFPARNVAPHEVFFQAMTLFDKANQLTFERIRDSANPPSTPSGMIEPKDVHEAITAALERLRLVSLTLKGSSAVAVPPREPSRTPTDVFQLVVQANRQLNLLLDRRVAPKEAYRQITVAMSYAASLLNTLPGSSSPPAPPEFVSGKRPSEVFGRLLYCLDLIRHIFKKTGVRMLELDTEKMNIGTATPSDVLDIASLLVSELAFLHTQWPGAAPARRVYQFGDKLPSHVFQRAGMLELQLQELLRKVDKNAATITRKKR